MNTSRRLAPTPPVAALVVLLFGVTACSQSPSSDASTTATACGDLRLATRRQTIVGGDTAWDDSIIDLLPGQAGAVGAIMTRGRFGFENSCSGTLVGPSAVLTAAHCIEDESDPDDVEVAIGPDADTALRLGVASMHMHPDYDPFGTAENDVAVLILDEPAAQVVDGIVPIAYSCQTLTSDLILNETVQTVGWGDAECGNRDHFAAAHDNCDFLDGLVGDPDPEPDPDPDPDPSPDAGPDGGIPDARTEPSDEAVSDATSSPDACGTITVTGHCDGDTAVWCGDGAVRRRRCDACGQQCGWSPSVGGYYCN